MSAPLDRRATSTTTIIVLLLLVGVFDSLFFLALVAVVDRTPRSILLVLESF